MNSKKLAQKFCISANADLEAHLQAQAQMDAAAANGGTGSQASGENERADINALAAPDDIRCVADKSIPKPRGSSGQCMAPLHALMVFIFPTQATDFSFKRPWASPMRSTGSFTSK